MVDHTNTARRRCFFDVVEPAVHDSMFRDLVCPSTLVRHSSEGTLGTHRSERNAADIFFPVLVCVASEISALTSVQ